MTDLAELRNLPNHSEDLDISEHVIINQCTARLYPRTNKVNYEYAPKLDDQSWIDYNLNIQTRNTELYDFEIKPSKDREYKCVVNVGSIDTPIDLKYFTESRPFHIHALTYHEVKIMITSDDKIPYIDLSWKQKICKPKGENFKYPSFKDKDGNFFVIWSGMGMTIPDKRVPTEIYDSIFTFV